MDPWTSTVVMDTAMKKQRRITSKDLRLTAMSSLNLFF